MPGQSGERGQEVTMKAYFDLLTACLLFSAQFIFTKLFSKKTKGDLQSGLVNGAVIAVVMALYLMPMNGFSYSFSRSALIWATVSGLSSVIMTFINVRAMKLGDLSIVTIYMLLGGQIIPFLYGVLWLNEELNAIKLISVVILTVALFPPVIEALAAKKKNAGADNAASGGGLMFHLLCLILFIGNGMVSIATKAHVISTDAIPDTAFTMLCASEQAVLLVLILLAFAVRNAVKKKEKPISSVFTDIVKEQPVGAKTMAALLCISVCYSVCNGVANLFSQSCAHTMDSSIQFPILSAAIIVLTALIGRIFFREKITAAKAISIVLSLIGVVMMIFA